jgi:PIN domain nuclease of toxin-antitoxin system
VRLLLDTQVLLWWMQDDDGLGPDARGLIEDPASDVLVSVVSLWEIVIKARIGKLRADIAKIARVVEAEGFAMLGISREHLLTASELPRHHRDPFDHLLIAQAIVEGASFVTADANAERYPVARLTAK